MKPMYFISIVISSVVATVAIIGVLGFVARDELAALMVAESDSRYTESVTKSDSLPQLDSDTLTIPDVVAAVNPAVVSVVITKDVPTYERYYEQYNPFGFGGGFSVPRLRESGTQEREIGGGSGFIVNQEGMIVTNRHVVADLNARYSILLNDGTNYAVDVLARDPQLDIAILQISEPIAGELTHVPFGDSETLRLGEPVIAIGNALAEFRNSVSVGVISGLSRSVVASDARGQTEQLDQVIQTDAAINPGNSGGPLLNSAGQVIGVNVATSRGADNIGFALPAHVVASVVESVEQYGEIVRPFLGVRYAMITPAIAEINQLEVDYGALVIRGELPQQLAVLPGSPADMVGITENTIILAIDGEELRERDLATVLRDKTVGETIELRILQNGEEKTVTTTLEKSP